MPQRLDKIKNRKCKKVIRDFLKQCKLEFNHALENVIIVGSLAHGDFVEDYSDIDIVTIFKGNKFPKAIDGKFADIVKRLELKYPSWGEKLTTEVYYTENNLEIDDLTDDDALLPKDKEELIKNGIVIYGDISHIEAPSSERLREGSLYLLLFILENHVFSKKDPPIRTEALNQFDFIVAKINILFQCAQCFLHLDKGILEFSESRIAQKCKEYYNNVWVKYLLIADECRHKIKKKENSLIPWDAMIEFKEEMINFVKKKKLMKLQKEILVRESRYSDIIRLLSESTLTFCKNLHFILEMGSFILSFSSKDRIGFLKKCFIPNHYLLIAELKNKLKGWIEFIIIKEKAVVIGYCIYDKDKERANNVLIPLINRTKSICSEMSVDKLVIHCCEFEDLLKNYGFLAEDKYYSYKLNRTG